MVLGRGAGTQLFRILSPPLCKIYTDRDPTMRAGRGWLTSFFLLQGVHAGKVACQRLEGSREATSALGALHGAPRRAGAPQALPAHLGRGPAFPAIQDTRRLGGWSGRGDRSGSGASGSGAGLVLGDPRVLAPASRTRPGGDACEPAAGSSASLAVAGGAAATRSASPRSGPGEPRMPRLSRCLGARARRDAADAARPANQRRGAAASPARAPAAGRGPRGCRRFLPRALRTTE
jgi:hypothetical protein